MLPCTASQEHWHFQGGTSVLRAPHAHATADGPHSGVSPATWPHLAHICPRIAILTGELAESGKYVSSKEKFGPYGGCERAGSTQGRHSPQDTDTKTHRPILAASLLVAPWTSCIIGPCEDHHSDAMRSVV